MIVSIDIFNGVVMIIAMCLTLPFAISSHGGWDAVVSTIEAKNPAYLSLFEGHDFLWVVGIILPTFLLLLSESSVYQKFSSAKDAKGAKQAVMGMFAGVVVIEFIMCAIAVVEGGGVVRDMDFDQRIQSRAGQGIQCASR